MLQRSFPRIKRNSSRMLKTSLRRTVRRDHLTSGSWELSWRVESKLQSDYIITSIWCLILPGVLTIVINRQQLNLVKFFIFYQHLKYLSLMYEICIDYCLYSYLFHLNTPQTLKLDLRNLSRTFRADREG